MEFRAEARQRLRLSLPEFGKLTPREVDLELSASNKIRRERSDDLRLFDLHLSRMQALFVNAHSAEGGARVDDFLLLKSSDEPADKKQTKKQRERQRKADETHMQIMAAAQENLRRRKPL